MCAKSRWRWFQNLLFAKHPGYTWRLLDIAWPSVSPFNSYFQCHKTMRKQASPISDCPCQIPIQESDRKRRGSVREGGRKENVGKASQKHTSSRPSTWFKLVLPAARSGIPTPALVPEIYSAATTYVSYCNEHNFLYPRLSPDALHKQIMLWKARYDAPHTVVHKRTDTSFITQTRVRVRPHPRAIL